MPLFWLSLAFISGILLGEFTVWPLKIWLSLAALAFAFELLIRLIRCAPRYQNYIQAIPANIASRIKRYPALFFQASPLLLMLVLVLGGARMAIAQPEINPGHIAWYNDENEKFIVEGWVTNWPDKRDQYLLLTVEAQRIRKSSEQTLKPVHGLLLAKLPPGGAWHYGDEIRLEGRLITAYEDETFSYRQYLARRNIYTTLNCSNCISCPNAINGTCAWKIGTSAGNPILTIIYRLRENALGVVYRLLPDPEASLLAGILLGVESGIPEDVMRDFVNTGTAHIIAISGFNFAIVAGLCVTFLGRLLGRWRGMLVAFIAMTVYAIVAGAGAGVIRAAIMGGLSVFALQIGRRQSGLTTLAFVAALMAIADPYVLWNVSFQMSFMATLGLILYSGILIRGFERLVGRYLPQTTVQRISKPVGEYFLYTIAAELTLLPIIMYHFQRFSLLSLLSNPLVLPAQPPIMIFGGLTTFAGLAWLPAGWTIALVTWPFLAYTIRVVEKFADLPGSILVTGQLNLTAVVIYYSVIFGLTMLAPVIRPWIAVRIQGMSTKIGWATLVLLGLITIMVWQFVLSSPDGRLHLTLFDVGTGDAMLVQSPTGRIVLIDGGPSPSALADSLGRRLPFHQRSIDFLVVAAANEEQLAGLPQVLERFQARRILWSGPIAGNFIARSLFQDFRKASTPVVNAEPGMKLDLGGDAELHVLSTSRRGSVLLLQMGNFQVLLPIGLDFESMEGLQKKSILPSLTALLLADGGYAPLNTSEWINHWQPQVILLSVGAGNREGLPDPGVLQSLKGYNLLRTDEHGWIELSTDGQKMWLETEK